MIALQDCVPKQTSSSIKIFLRTEPRRQTTQEQENRTYCILENPVLLGGKKEETRILTRIQSIASWCLEF